MGRWQKPPNGPERYKFEREAAKQVGGVLRPEDKRGAAGSIAFVAGRQELVGVAEDALPDHSKTTIYAAVNTMQAQSWMLTMPDGAKATVPSSATYWLQARRYDEAHIKQLGSANNAPTEGSQPRGRPRRQD